MNSENEDDEKRQKLITEIGGAARKDGMVTSVDCKFKVKTIYNYNSKLTIVTVIHQIQGELVPDLAQKSINSNHHYHSETFINRHFL